MKKLFDSYIYKILVDASGIISTIVLASEFLKGLIKNFKSYDLFTKICIVLLVLFSFALILRSLRSIIVKATKLSDKRLKDKQNKESTKFISEELTPELIFPDNNYVNNSYKLIMKEAEAWDDQSVLTTFNLRIKVSGSQIEYSTQAYLYSKLKKLEMELYSFAKKRYYSEVTRITKKDSVIPFNKVHSNWLEFASVAYCIVSEKLGNEYSLTINSSEKPSIIFRYKYGRVDKTYQFDLKEDTIVDIQTGEEIKLG